MLRWFPAFQVATTYFSCSPPDLNLLVTDFMFCLHGKSWLPPGDNPIAVNKYYCYYYYSYAQLFTVISVSLCNSVKVANMLRDGRPRDRCSIPGSSSLLYSNPQPSDPIQGRPNVIFNGNQRIFRWGGGGTKGHIRYCGQRRGSHVEKSQ